MVSRTSHPPRRSKLAAEHVTSLDSPRESRSVLPDHAGSYAEGECADWARDGDEQGCNGFLLRSTAAEPAEMLLPLDYVTSSAAYLTVFDGYIYEGSPLRRAALSRFL